MVWQPIKVRMHQEAQYQHSKKGIVAWTYSLSFEMRHNNKVGVQSVPWSLLLHGLLHIKKLYSKTYHSGITFPHTIKLDIEQHHTFLRINSYGSFVWYMWRRTSRNHFSTPLSWTLNNFILSYPSITGIFVEEKWLCSVVCLCGCTMVCLWRRNDGNMVCQWRRNDSIWRGRHVA